MIVLGYDPGASLGYALVDTGEPPRVIWCGAASRDAVDLARALDTGVTVDLVAIERVETVYSRARFGASMATALVAAARVEQRLADCAERRGWPVLYVTAGDWRRAIAGSRTASDARIKRALTLRFGDVLPRTNAHARDAIGVALYGAAVWGRAEAIGRADGISAREAGPEVVDYPRTRVQRQKKAQ